MDQEGEGHHAPADGPDDLQYQPAVGDVEGPDEVVQSDFLEEKGSRMEIFPHGVEGHDNHGQTPQDVDGFNPWGFKFIHSACFGGMNSDAQLAGLFSINKDGGGKFVKSQIPNSKFQIPNIP